MDLKPFFEPYKITGFCRSHLPTRIGMLLACSAARLFSFLSFIEQAVRFFTRRLFNLEVVSPNRTIFEKKKEELLCEAFCACWQAD
jgi:hypothetical protein